MKVVVAMFRDDDVKPEELEKFAITKSLFIPLHFIDGDRDVVKEKVNKWLDKILE